LLKVKEGENFNRRNTLSILRIKICSLTQRLGKKAIYGWTLANCGSLVFSVVELLITFGSDSDHLKFQNTSTKFQINSKQQYPITKTALHH